VAAVQGHAFGGGFLLALGCDLCVCDETAKLAISEVKRGRGSPWAAPLFSMVPKRVMSELLLTGEPIEPARAFQVGLVNRVVPPGEAVATATHLARQIARNAPLSVGAARDMIEFCSEVGEGAADRAAYWLYEHVYRSRDALEGPAAFAEKRDPVWEGA
jgi:enoyl-CoA hydratase/carnithine racemase